jgi:DNA replication and repair protein RecF
VTGLFLRALTLSHFRSHKRAVLALDGRPVAIHGPNGAGKTNILEAVSLLSPGRGLRRAAADEIARRPEALGWKVTALLQSLHQLHEVETWAEDGAPRQVRIDDKPAPQLALGRIARVVWLVPAQDRLWTEGAEARRRFLDRMAMSFEPGHADAVLVYEKAMRERNRLLKDGQTDRHWYHALEAQMAKAGAEIQVNRAFTVARLAAAQAEAETSFPAADLQVLHAEGAEEGPEGEAALPRRSRPDAGATSPPGARWRARTGPIWRRATRRRASPPGTPRPASRRRCWSRWCWPMPARWQRISARRRSFCSTRSRRIWTPTAARRFMTRSAPLARRRS